MASTMLPFQQIASTSGAKPKRKRAGSVEAEEVGQKHLRIVPPQFNDPNGFSTGFPGFASGFPPDLVPDMTTSATASESDNMMDHDMDFDMDDALETPSYNDTTQYCYAASGSGGFGFGPGAEEDEMESDDGSPKTGYAELGYYPSSNQYAQSTPVTPATPWGNQGLIQPTTGAALGPEASAIERARNAHGPHCKSIPQLRMSDYPDVNGHRSLWSVCPDCGTCERAS